MSYVSSYDLWREMNFQGKWVIKNFKVLVYHFFQNLSKCTLAQSRALRPLFKELHKKNIKYKWGFPFSLIVESKENTVILRFPAEIAYFCKTLGIPKVALLLWMSVSFLSTATPTEEWKLVKKKESKGRKLVKLKMIYNRERRNK